MRFVIEPEVFSRFPGTCIAAVVAHGLSNTEEDPALARAWEDAWRSAAEDARPYGNAQSHPRVAPWRERFRAMGVSGKEFPSSIEAMLRRAIKGGEPFRINPLVDFYNTVSLRHSVPAGGFDLAGIETLDLRITRPGDTFLALDEHEPIDVPQGELAYATGHIVLTRHFVWRQSQQGLLRPETRDVILMSEVLGEIGPEVAAAVRDEFTAGLRRYFGVEGHGAILSADQPEMIWE